MAMIYTLRRGILESERMSLDYDSGLVTVRYFNVSGVEIFPATMAAITVSPSLAGEDFKAVYPSSANQWSFEGPAARLRVSLAGTGAVTAEFTVWRGHGPMSMIPPGAFTGLRAICTQTYVEANVKNGVQFYIQHNVPSLAASSGVSKLLFTTGAKKVLVKGRELYGVAERAQIQLFKQPTAPAPGGTLLTVQNFNDDILPVPASTVVVRSGVTTTADGTSWGDPQRLFGQSGVGQRTGSGLAPGGDRILKANSTYLVVFSNLGSGTAELDYFLTWFEGDGDLPLK